MNSEPLIEKKGTPASPATARAKRVLPVPGGPINSTPLGIAPEPLKLAGVLEELDNFLQLELGLLQGGHVFERSPLLRGLKPLGLAADEVSHHAAAHGIDVPPHHVDEEENQDHRADQPEQGLLRVARLVGSRIVFRHSFHKLLPEVGILGDSLRDDRVELLGQLVGVGLGGAGVFFQTPVRFSP